MLTLVVPLSAEELALARSSDNRYFTWLALGRPVRHVSDQEAEEYYARTQLPKKDQMSLREFYEKGGDQVS